MKGRRGRGRRWTRVATQERRYGPVCEAGEVHARCWVMPDSPRKFGDESVLHGSACAPRGEKCRRARLAGWAGGLGREGARIFARSTGKEGPGVVGAAIGCVVRVDAPLLPHST